MNVPDDLTYSSDHEWIRVEDGLFRIGITDYAQDALGDVVYVQLPEAGAEFGAGDALGEIESTKSVSEVYAPVQGKVVEVNADLEANPELVNGEPYGTGWLVVLEPVDLRSVETLLDAAAYRELTEA